MKTITDAQKLIRTVSVPDSMNILLATSAGAFDAKGEEQVHLAYATSFQLEGYVLNPRRSAAYPFEVVTEDPEEAQELLRLVRLSQAPLAERQASAVLFANQALGAFAGLEPADYNQLGSYAYAKEEA